jgi:hypothetical protein
MRILLAAAILGSAVNVYGARARWEDPSSFDPLFEEQRIPLQSPRFGRAEHGLRAPQYVHSSLECCRRYRLGEDRHAYVLIWCSESFAVVLVAPLAKPEQPELSSSTQEGSSRAWLVHIHANWVCGGFEHDDRPGWESFIATPDDEKPDVPFVHPLEGTIAVRLTRGRTERIELDLQPSRPMPLAPWSSPSLSEHWSFEDISRYYALYRFGFSDYEGVLQSGEMQARWKGDSQRARIRGEVSIHSVLFSFRLSSSSP